MPSNNDNNCFVCFSINCNGHTKRPATLSNRTHTPAASQSFITAPYVASLPSQSQPNYCPLVPAIRLSNNRNSLLSYCPSDRLEFDAPLPAASSHCPADGRRHGPSHRRFGARTIPHLRLPGDGLHRCHGLSEPAGKCPLHFCNLLLSFYIIITNATISLFETDNKVENRQQPVRQRLPRLFSTQRFRKVS